MELDLVGKHADRAYPLLASLVTPRPIAWVTVNARAGDPNWRVGAPSPPSLGDGFKPSLNGALTEQLPPQGGCLAPSESNCIVTAE